VHVFDVFQAFALFASILEEKEFEQEIDDELDNAHEERRGRVAQLYSVAAERGRIEACYNLGLIQLMEMGDTLKATEYFQRCVDRGYEPARDELSKAQLELGVDHLVGVDVDIDLVKADHYFKLAAKNGDKRALAFAESVSLFGANYDRNLVKPNYHRLSWKKLEELNDPESLFERAHRLHYGIGYQPDYDKALALLISAAKLGHPIAFAQFLVLLEAEADRETKFECLDRARHLCLGLLDHCAGKCFVFAKN
jgi:TPR repeat protein